MGYSELPGRLPPKKTNSGTGNKFTFLPTSGWMLLPDESFCEATTWEHLMKLIRIHCGGERLHPEYVTQRWEVLRTAPGWMMQICSVRGGMSRPFWQAPEDIRLFVDWSDQEWQEYSQTWPGGVRVQFEVTDEEASEILSRIKSGSVPSPWALDEDV